MADGTPHRLLLLPVVHDCVARDDCRIDVGEKEKTEVHSSAEIIISRQKRVFIRSATAMVLVKACSRREKETSRRRFRERVLVDAGVVLAMDRNVSLFGSMDRWMDGYNKGDWSGEDFSGGCNSPTTHSR